MPETSKDIVVHLERSRTARAFDLGRESLWEKELKEIYAILESHIEALRAFREPEMRKDFDGGDNDRGSWKDDRRPILSIAIFGTHGSGKSSLLKTLVEEVNERSSTGSRDENEKLKLYALPVIEPNRLAEDEHFLYTYLATALEEDLVRQRREERSLSASRASRALTPVQQSFQEVSEYLQVIDKAERASEHDPLGFSLERLERHTSGLLLRKKLHTFHDLLAGSLTGTGTDRDSPSLVLLPVDDADMSLDGLVPTLDAYRRFLQHPRLVPIFTFTGRLAEELLRVHFARNLLVEESRKLFDESAFDDASSRLGVPEHLAVQYLAKLFPIRNRIRLGPAPARVQKADYKVGETQRESRKIVWHLLEAASNLLFGYPEWPIAPRIRLALRPATLRRQLQVLDAMHDCRVDQALELQNQTRKRMDLERRWAEIFGKAAWALVNVHRDVVREFGMQIEELHSLTPRNLSREILNAVLSLDLELRRELLQRWRLQVEDRRGQVLSLLALNAFRPHMKGEELSGDDPDAMRILRESPATRGTDKAGKEKNNSFSVLKGLLWFLDLWTGFYLPQILARDRPNDIAEKDYELRSVRGVGWDLRSGPRHAMTEVLLNKHISATGMMLVDPDDFSKGLSSKDEAAVLAVHLWCFFGYRRGRPWAAVSFWRGLGLVGQILEDFQRETAGPSPGGAEDRTDRISMILSRHCGSAMEPGSFQVGGTFFRKESFEPETESIRALAGEINKWVASYPEARIVPIRCLPENKKNDPTWWQNAFKQSFIRRLHGDYLLGEFWPNVGGAYLEGPGVPPSKRRWDARSVLQGWTGVLTDYFDEVKIDSEDHTLPEMLRACPLFACGEALPALVQVTREKSPFFESSHSDNPAEAPRDEAGERPPAGKTPAGRRRK